MEIDAAILARYAEYSPDGTLVLAGAGLSGVMSQPLAAPALQPGTAGPAVGTPVYFFVAIRVAFARSDLASPHTLQVQVNNAGGALVFSTPAAPLAIADNPYIPPGMPLAMQVPVSCGFAPSAFGQHTVTIALDGVPQKRLAFIVVQPPPQNFGMSPQG